MAGGVCSEREAEPCLVKGAGGLLKDGSDLRKGSSQVDLAALLLPGLGFGGLSGVPVGRDEVGAGIAVGLGLLLGARSRIGGGLFFVRFGEDLLEGRGQHLVPGKFLLPEFFGFDGRFRNGILEAVFGDAVSLLYHFDEGVMGDEDVLFGNPALRALPPAVHVLDRAVRELSEFVKVGVEYLEDDRLGLGVHGMDLNPRVCFGHSLSFPFGSVN